MSDTLAQSEAYRTSDEDKRRIFDIAHHIAELTTTVTTGTADPADDLRKVRQDWKSADVMSFRISGEERAFLQGIMADAGIITTSGMAYASTREGHSVTDSSGFGLIFDVNQHDIVRKLTNAESTLETLAELQRSRVGQELHDRMDEKLRGVADAVVAHATRDGEVDDRTANAVTRLAALRLGQEVEQRLNVELPVQYRAEEAPSRAEGERRGRPSIVRTGGSGGAGGRGHSF